MKSINILNVKIDNINYKDTLKKIFEFVKSKKAHQICTVNPEYIMEAQKDQELMTILHNSDLNVADGSGLFLGAKITHQKLDYKVTGVDLVEKIFEDSEKNNYKIFLLGGINKVAFKTAKILKNKYPKSKIVGVYEGYPHINPISKKIYEKNYIKKNMDFKKNPPLNNNNLKIIKEVTSKKPDILLVAYGCPKQDKFIARFRNYLNIPVSIGVGGTFDYISKNIQRAPLWMRKLWLEWLYRLFKEPNRITRIFTATIKFPLKIIFSKNNVKQT